jgi:hypothetical protein
LLYPKFDQFSSLVTSMHAVHRRPDIATRRRHARRYRQRLARHRL